MIASHDLNRGEWHRHLNRYAFESILFTHKNVSFAPLLYRVHLTSLHAPEWGWKTWKPFKDSDHMLACTLQLAENSGSLSTGNNYYDRQFSALLLSNHRKYIKILIQRNNFHMQTLETTSWSSDTFTLFIMSNKFQEACLMCSMHIETCYTM